MCHQICEYVKSAQIAAPPSFSIDKFVDNIRHTFSEFIIDRSPGPA